MANHKNILEGQWKEGRDFVPELLRAKEESDRKNYSVKHAILRKLIKESPGEFVIDSEEGGAYGITHKPSGFKIHILKAVAPPELTRAQPEKQDKATVLNRIMKKHPSLGTKEEVETLYHGSPTGGIAQFEPRPHKLTPKPAIFATSDENLALSMAVPATDDDLAMGYEEDTDTGKRNFVIDELQPGKLSLLDAPAYLYDLPASTFSQRGAHPELMQDERISHAPVTPSRVREIKNVLQELRNRNVTIRPYDEVPEWKWAESAQVVGSSDVDKATVLNRIMKKHPSLGTAAKETPVHAYITGPSGGGKTTYTKENYPEDKYERLVLDDFSQFEKHMTPEEWAVSGGVKGQDILIAWDKIMERVQQSKKPVVIEGMDLPPEKYRGLLENAKDKILVDPGREEAIRRRILRGEGENWHSGDTDKAEGERLWEVYQQMRSEIERAGFTTPEEILQEKVARVAESTAAEKAVVLNRIMEKHPSLGRKASDRGGLKPDVKLQPHQQRIVDAAGPGIRKLLYHGLGSGKTLSAIAAAEKTQQPYGAVVPAALRPNFAKEQEKFTDEQLASDIQSYTMLARGHRPKHTGTVIMDEAHRLRNPDTEQTRVAKQLAEATDQLYLLSGSPIVNAPADLAPLMEMLTQETTTPEAFNEKYLSSKPVTPSWIDRWKGVTPGVVHDIKNKKKLHEALRGKVDYHEPAESPVAREEERIVVDMSPEQEQLHNEFYGTLPSSLRRKLDMQFPLSKSEQRSFLAFLSGPRQVALSTAPWQSEEDRAKTGLSQSPKLQRAISELEAQIEEDPESRAVVFSNFITAGLEPYAAALEAKKIPHGIFHGGLNDKQRAELVNKYNSGDLRVLLMGPSGGEGLSLEGTKLIQLLDPHWNETRLNQAIGRGIRYDSHKHLPEKDRKVKVQRFISQLPEKKRKGLLDMLSLMLGRKKPVRDAADAHLENYARDKQRLNDRFLAELKNIGTEKGSVSKQAADKKRSKVTHIAGPSGAGKTTALNRILEKHPHLVTKDLDDLDWEAMKSLGWGWTNKRDMADKKRSKFNARKQQLLDQLLEESKGKDVALGGHHINHGHILTMPEDTDKRLLNTGALRSTVRAFNREKGTGTLRSLRRLLKYRENKNYINYLKSMGYTPQSQDEVVESFGKQAAEEQWIGVDLDGTLAKYRGWKGATHIGTPIPSMVSRVKRWLREGKVVKIFTARAAGDDGTARRAIEKWCKTHIGKALPITCVKDKNCVRIWDDRAVGVKSNKGRQVKLEYADKLTAAVKLAKARSNKSKDKEASANVLGLAVNICLVNHSSVS